MNILGFDRRYGISIPADTEYKFFLGKCCETYRNYTLVNHYLPEQFDIARARGMTVGAWLYHIEDGKPTYAAAEYYRLIRDLGTEWCPIVDVEDEPATGAHIWATVQAVEQKFGEMAMVYSARWCWDDSNYLPPGHPIFTRPLFESDPPPATPSPGYWGNPVIQQTRLDWGRLGYNGTIDEDVANDVWHNENVYPRFGGIITPTTKPIVTVQFNPGEVDVKLETI